MLHAFLFSGMSEWHSDEDTGISFWIRCTVVPYLFVCLSTFHSFRLTVALSDLGAPFFFRDDRIWVDEYLTDTDPAPALGRVVQRLDVVRQDVAATLGPIYIFFRL